MTPLAWGLLAFGAWSALILALAFLAGAERKPTPQSDFQQWESER